MILKHYHKIDGLNNDFNYYHLNWQLSISRIQLPRKVQGPLDSQKQSLDPALKYFLSGRKNVLRKTKGKKIEIKIVTIPQNIRNNKIGKIFGAKKLLQKYQKISGIENNDEYNAIIILAIECD